MDSTLTKYLTPYGYTVLVLETSNGMFRAYTNDGAWIGALEGLPPRPTEQEAQTDLDALATMYNLRIEGNR